jgi:hypothetical protein
MTGWGTRSLSVLLTALGFTLVVNAQAPAQDDSLVELMRRVQELHRAGKFEEAIPLAEKLVAPTKRVKGEEDADNLFFLHGCVANAAALC